MENPIEIERIREAFPALASSTVFLENAGGSQVPRVVAERIRNYLLNSYVQLDAGYELSQICTRVVDQAHRFASRLMNGSRGHVILGSSTTSLIRMLSECYAEVLTPGSEIILAENGHEANLGPWVRLADRGLKVQWWKVEPQTGTSPLAGLESLLSERTAIVAFPHVSNLLGEIGDLKAITESVHDAGARVVVDGVAFAPHRAMDVDDWDVDWYAYSTYKVYGPHMAVLYGRADAVAELTGPNHFFIPRDEVPYKFELGGPSHEGCAGLLALGEYLQFLAGVQDESSGMCDRGTIETAFKIMAACERPVQERLLSYLSNKPGVRIIGPIVADKRRVSTISFVHERLNSRDIVAEIDRSGIAIRHGHMYAYRLCQALGLDPEDGVVRVSAVHYNTTAEIERLIDLLERVLPS
jgi:cysteine desulfurase family protein (TIGR01976 family)